jgi:hypothetical protein
MNMAGKRITIDIHGLPDDLMEASTILGSLKQPIAAFGEAISKHAGVTCKFVYSDLRGPKAAATATVAASTEPQAGTIEQIGAAVRRHTAA